MSPPPSKQRRRERAFGMGYAAGALRRPRLVYVVTHPASAEILLRGQLAFMRERGFDVTVIAAGGPALERVRDREGVAVMPVPMTRDPSPRTDVVSLARLTRAVRLLAPDIVNAGTPKAGLLGMMAARAARVPVRIYLLRGLRLETATGTLRRVLAATERIASRCAHDVACVSASLRDLAVVEGYVQESKATVIGAGSSNGVDTQRFQRTDALRAEGARLLAELGVAPEDRVVAFVGRVAIDKGIGELLDAFEQVRRKVPRAKLLLLGGNLASERSVAALAQRLAAAPHVVVTGTIADLAPFYARMDVLALPSHREGFPNVVLEAACAEVPVVGFRSTGIVDAVVDGTTGVLVERGDSEGLASAITGYLENEERRAAHGVAARERAVRLFGRDAIWSAWLDAYRKRLAARGLPLPR